MLGNEQQNAVVRTRVDQDELVAVAGQRTADVVRDAPVRREWGCPIGGAKCAVIRDGHVFWRDFDASPPRQPREKSAQRQREQCNPDDQRNR